jgi:hypothetical protein
MTNKPNTSNMITGQFIFRHNGSMSTDGRKLTMVVGILAIPTSYPIKSEHQYAVNGVLMPGFDGIKFGMEAMGIDLTKQLHGDGLDGMIRMPIWRY